jgi:hypothetical protein
MSEATSGSPSPQDVIAIPDIAALIRATLVNVLTTAIQTPYNALALSFKMKPTLEGAS